MSLLKLQAGFAGGVRQSLDSAVVQEPAPVEHDRAHPGRLGLGRDRLADLGGLVHTVALGLELDRRCGRQRAVARVVDELRVDVVEAAKYRKPWALRRAGHVHAHAPVALQAVDLAVLAFDHAVVLAPFPALPALRRTFSSRYLTPLPLYGSGGRRPRMLAATWPTSSIEIPLTENLVGSATSIEIPCGGLKRIGCE